MHAQWMCYEQSGLPCKWVAVTMDNFAGLEATVLLANPLGHKRWMGVIGTLAAGRSLWLLLIARICPSTPCTYVTDDQFAR